MRPLADCNERVSVPGAKCSRAAKHKHCAQIVKTVWFCTEFNKAIDSGITGRGWGDRVPPWHFSPGNFCWPIRKRQGRQKGKWRRRKIKKGGGEGRLKIENGRRKSYKVRRGPFFFFFAFHFSKPLKFVLGLPTKMGICHREKAYRAGKKFRKNDFAPLKKFLLMPLAIGSIFQIYHILWHFQDGCHWPWGLPLGQKLKHASISLKIVSNCLLCYRNSKNV